VGRPNEKRTSHRSGVLPSLVEPSCIEQPSRRARLIGSPNEKRTPHRSGILPSLVEPSCLEPPSRRARARLANQTKRSEVVLCRAQEERKLFRARQTPDPDVSAAWPPCPRDKTKRGPCTEVRVLVSLVEPGCIKQPSRRVRTWWVSGPKRSEAALCRAQEERKLFRARKVPRRSVSAHSPPRPQIMPRGSVSAFARLRRRRAASACFLRRLTLGLR
jgi:hypothetical protein